MNGNVYDVWHKSMAPDCSVLLTNGCLHARRASFEVIGGQSSQDEDQLSATLKRLEVGPVDPCHPSATIALICRGLGKQPSFTSPASWAVEQYVFLNGQGFCV